MRTIYCQCLETVSEGQTVIKSHLGFQHAPFLEEMGLAAQSNVTSDANFIKWSTGSLPYGVLVSIVFISPFF